MPRLSFLVIAVVLTVSNLVSAQDVVVDSPSLVLTDVPFEVKVSNVTVDSATGFSVTIDVGGESTMVDASSGSATGKVSLSESGSNTISVSLGGAQIASKEIRVIPGWLSLLPALLAIGLALIFRQVIPAIFLGLVCGSWLVYGGTFSGLWFGLLDSVEVYVVQSLTDSGHVSILVFSMLIGGMVGIISANGGTLGIVAKVVKWAKTPNRGQLATSFLGMAIFFDDYANTLIVGNTMRPVTDRLRISREKLAYIVDSTAAPISALALVTTWIGFEVGLIDAAVSLIPGYDESAYSIFINSIGYSFYPILAVFFVLLVSYTGRDWGPMLVAETRARREGLVSSPGANIGASVEEESALRPRPGRPNRAINAVLPVLVMAVGTLVGIYITGVQSVGSDATLRDIIGSGDSYKALVWASLLGVMIAAGLSLVQRILSLGEVVEAWFAGLKSMMLALIILVLAWSLSGVNTVIQTGPYLVSTLGDTIAPEWLPAIVFVLSAVTAFGTGTSWGVMGIMMPLVIPLAWAIVSQDPNEPVSFHILYSSVSAVLAGAVWGDHCSPISDTTILSSMASECDHIDHVRTQLPYAFVVGIVGLLVGTLPVAYGMPWWLGILIGVSILTVGLRIFGTKNDEYDPEAIATG